MFIEILQHRIKYWYTDEQEMPDYEQEHIKQCIVDGLSSGQLVDSGIDGEAENVGWWEIVK